MTRYKTRYYIIALIAPVLMAVDFYIDNHQNTHGQVSWRVSGDSKDCVQRLVVWYHTQPQTVSDHVNTPICRMKFSGREFERVGDPEGVKYMEVFHQ